MEKMRRIGLLLLTGMLALTFGVRQAIASGSIYIRSDGSIDPPAANITTVDNVSYYLTGDINETIYVQRSNIIVDGNGFMIQGSDRGFYLEYVDNVTIQNTNIQYCGDGIVLVDSANYNIISGNIITNNSGLGIWIYCSSNNIISGNTITSNDWDGVSVHEGDYNIISGNTITNNGWVLGVGAGVDLYESYLNTVSGNTIINNNYGVQLYHSSHNNTVSGNNITNSPWGIYIRDSFLNDVSRNDITNNGRGVFLYSSNDNGVCGNTITDNNDLGVKLRGSSFNTVFGNTITNNNTCGVEVYSSSNNNIVFGNDITDNNDYGVVLWDSDCYSNSFYHNNFVNNIPNHVQLYIEWPPSDHGNAWDDGYPSGGNYWDDYTGMDSYSGPNQDQPGSDGIGDTLNSLGFYNADHYPLMSSWSPPSYDVTIKTHCDTEHMDVNVSIAMDGSPTGYNSPHTFTSLTGTHTFTVPYRDLNDHPFKQWGAGGKTTRTKTVITGGTYTAYYQLKYNLTITKAGDGWTDPYPGTHSYPSGSFAEVHAIPDICYQLDHWELDGNNVDSNNPYSVLMDGDHTLHAVFVQTAYNYDLTITGTSGGTMDPNRGTHTYACASLVQVRATPEPCYEFDHWEPDGNDVNSANPISVVMDSNHTLHAVFVHSGDAYDLTITASPSSGGTTEPNVGTHAYPCGSSAEVTAIPDECYLFDHWKLDENNVGPNNPYSVVMDANHTLEAVFVQQGPYDLTITGTSGGTTEPNVGTYVYGCGSVVEVNAIPYECYEFVHWLDGNDVNSANPISVVMDSNHTLEAVFVQKDPYALTIAAACGGTTEPSPGTHKRACDATVEVTALPEAYYVLHHWALDGNDVGSDTPYSVSLDIDHRFHWLYAIFFRAKASVPSPGDGAEDVDPNTVLSWLPGVDAADMNGHDVYFSTSFAEVNDANSSWPVASGPNDPNVYKGRQDFNSYDPYALELGITYYWRVDEVNETDGNSPWKGDVWSFTTNDGTAWNPSPKDEAEDVGTDVILSWVPGIYAAWHDVYLGTDKTAVEDANTSSAEWKEPRLALEANSYDPCGLELGATYYWRIDEVNDPHPNSPWKGDVWSFTTGHIVVDDFDSYPDYWLLVSVWDDYLVNGTGSQISLETDANLTRDGNSMRYEYTNDTMKMGKPIGSAVDADPIDLESGRDWTGGGVKALVLYFLGDPCTVISELGSVWPWLELEDTNSNSSWVMYPDPNHVTEPTWHEWNIDLAIFDACGVALSSIERLTIGIGGSRVGQESKASTTNRLWFDDIRLYPPRCIPEYAIGSLDDDCITNLEDVKVMAEDWLLFDHNIPVEEPCDANLLVEYVFDNNNLEDTSGNGHHGINVNEPNVHDGILTLNDSNYVEIPLGADNPFDGSCGFSIAMDFRTEEPGILISSARGNNSLNHSMSVYIPECAEEVIYGNFWVGAARVADNPLDGEWHTMVTTYDAGTEVHITYLDYQQGEKIKFDPNIPNIEEDMVRIGGSLNTEYPYKISGNFVGDIDNIRIYDCTLSYNEVLALLGEEPGTYYYVPVDSDAELYSEEPVNEKIINFKDFAVLADYWLEEILWPEP